MELAQYLMSNSIGDFRKDELNEIILTVYNVIKRAVRDEADELRLNHSHFVWKRRGLQLGEFQIDDLKPSMAFKDALRLVINRDDMIRHHLQLVVETYTEISYRFI